MEIYVDKLPDCCKICPCCSGTECYADIEPTKYGYKYLQIAERFANTQRHPKCPLKLIQDHDKDKDQSDKQIKKQEVLEKALELACKELRACHSSLCSYCRYLKEDCPEKCPGDTLERKMFFKEKAKGMLNNG